MYTQTTPITVIVIIAVFLGLSLGSFLILVQSEKNKGNFYLGLLVLMITLYLFPPFVDILGLLEKWPHVIRIRFLFEFAIGPVTYFYVSSCIQRDYQLEPRQSLHFVPTVLAWLYYSNFFMKSGAEKLEAYAALVNAGDLGLAPFVPALTAIHALIYFFISVRKVLLYKKHLRNTTSNIDFGFHRWLLVFSSALLLPLLTVSLFVIFGLQFISLFLIQCSIFLFILTVYIAVLFKPTIFHTFPHQIKLQEPEISKTKKYQNSLLKEDRKQKYLKTLMNHIQEKKSYQEPELTLPQLSEEINISVHHLSQVINEKLQCNFLDFINSYRIEEVKTKLANPNFNHFTIMAIAYESGFNSKSAFYAAFKKATHTTPSNFRKNVAPVVVK